MIDPGEVKRHSHRGDYSVAVPGTHSTTHENGGADEINVAGLSGVLADEQDAGQIKGTDVNTTGVADNNVLVYDSASGNWLIGDHGGIGGLGDDDHTQYLLADGSRNLGGNLNIGTYSLGDGTGTLVFDGSGNLTASGSINIGSGKTYKINSVDVLLAKNTDSFFLGPNAGLICTANYSLGMGPYALYASSGTYNCGVGYQSLYGSTGSYCSGNGQYVLRGNTGNFVNATGQNCGRGNAGNYCDASGVYSLYWGAGDYCVAFAYRALQYNCGDNCFGAGQYTLQYNNSSNNTALGGNAFSTWTDDAGSAVNFDNTDITVATDRITIAGHGFTGSYVNLKYTQGTSAITGMTDGTVYQFQIVDVNTLELRSGAITNAGTGTGHTLTPRVNYTNSTAIGANSEPDASNQVMLGDTSVTQVATAGDFRSDSGVLMLAETTTPSAVADYGKIYTKNDNKLYFQDGAGVEHEVSLV